MTKKEALKLAQNVKDKCRRGGDYLHYNEARNILCDDSESFPADFYARSKRTSIDMDVADALESLAYSYNGEIA